MQFRLNQINFKIYIIDDQLPHEEIKKLAQIKKLELYKFFIQPYKTQYKIS